MPRYPEEVIEEVRSRSDIVDVIQRYVQLKKKGSSYFGLCPFHNEKSPSFSVSRDKQMFYCFGCGAGGNVFTFLMNYENLTFPEAVQELAKECGITLPEHEETREDRARNKRRERMFLLQKEAATFYYSMLRTKDGERALAYFRKRGLSDETINKFGLGASDVYGKNLRKYLSSKGFTNEEMRDSGLIKYSEARGFEDRFFNRAMFPIMDAQKRVCGFGGRVMGDGEPKYLNSPETEIFDKGTILYGMHIARRTRRDYFILCEGYMDVISMHQAGFDNTVASLGTALTQKNALALKRYRKNIYLSYDSDGAGVKAALRAIGIFNSIGVPTKVINMRPYKDPDEFIKALGAEEYEKRIEEAENSFMYSIRMHEGEFDLKDPGGKTEFQKYMAGRVLEFEEEIERNNYISALCDKYNISIDSFRTLVAHEAAKGVSERSATKIDMGTERSIDDKPKKERMNAKTGMLQSERLLLSWIAGSSSIYSQLKEYLSPNDFCEGIHKEVAEYIFSEREAGKDPDPAALVDKYQEASDQKDIARIFHTEEALKAESDREKAITETLIKIKKATIERENEAMDPGDPGLFKKKIEDRKFMEKLEKIRINL
ncbi:MAG: DNA primase [Lachnospiraceae bacterium]|nr:DNA primase [Lachnospiraceae bacterium]